MLIISHQIRIPDSEIEFSAIRAQGSGGQNVNKVSTAIHLRFDINTSSLPELYKDRLRKVNDNRISKEGVIIIKAQQYRSQEKNKQEALLRLKEMICRVTQVKKRRLATKPSKGAKIKRLDTKTKRGRIKDSRKKVTDINN